MADKGVRIGIGGWMAPMGKNNKNNLGVFFLLLFYETYVKIIRLKAPGNYSDQFWPNKILVLLCEGPNLTYPWFLDFWAQRDPYFWIFIYQQTSKNKKHGSILKHIIIISYLNILGIQAFQTKWDYQAYKLLNSFFVFLLKICRVQNDLLLRAFSQKITMVESWYFFEIPKSSKHK